MSLPKHYTVFDLETGANKLHKRKGSPFDSRNKIYVNAYKTGMSDSVMTQYSREGVTKISIPWATTELLVGQNIKFDLLWIWKDPDFRDWLRNGGKIYDTMVAEFLLTAQQSQYCSLNKLADKYGGTQKVDVIKEYWESGIDTCDIDPAILLPYAESDILNTEKAFLVQMEAIRRESMGGLVEGYMDHLLALVEMEFNGLYLDIPGTLELRTELEKKQADLAAQMQKICDVFTDRLGIPRYEFTPTKPKDISAILFSTPIKHSYKVVDGVYGPTAKKAGQPKTKVINELLNLGGFGIPTFLTTEYKAKGVYQSGDKILQKILKDYKDPMTQEFVKALQDYRATSKILGTYVYGINNKGDEQGFLPLVNKADGCIHHCLDQVKAVTGRLNSHDPNMQNVPKDFRRLFPSRYKDTGVIMEMDYCLTPEMRVLTEEFSWKAVKDVEVGEVLIGFPEHTRLHDGATFRPSVVEKKKLLRKECVEIVTTAGTVRCSKDHMWKVSTSNCPLQWIQSEELQVGWALSKVMEVWETPNNYETGWMAGFLDGEGYLSNHSQIGVGQNECGDNLVAFRKMEELFLKYMHNIELRYSRKSKCVKVRPAGLRTGWQAIGIFQPLRLKEKLKRQYTQTSIRSKRNTKATILEIRDLGIQDVVAIQTSTKTFLAEGFLSHNCQLEIIVNAYLTQSEKLINDIKSGVDFHIKRAAYVAGISYEEAVQNLERYPEVWKEKRQQAKAVSYAKAYGAHPEKIAEDTGLQLEDIEKIYREEDREYPEVGEFNRQVEEEIKRNRIPTERLLSIKNKEDGTKAIREGEYQGIGYHKSVTGKIYAYLEYGTDSAKLRESGRGIYRYFKSTQIANQETQGMAADIVSLCVGRVFRTLDKMPELSAHVKMINEVHDSLVFDCENEHWANELSKVVQPILMDVTAAFTEKGLPKFNVPLNVETQIGKTWGG